MKIDIDEDIEESVRMIAGLKEIN